MSDDFDFEFHHELDQPVDDLREEALQRLLKLADGHTDLIGASVGLDKPAENRSTPHVFRARVVAYIRPDNIAAVQEDETAHAALKGALSALERQVRERRDKLRERWKQNS
jgi:ribosome-associated translation inhibitor RaiA